MDIKRRLIEKIEKIDDNIILNQLSELVSVSNDSVEIEFSDEQISKIQESQNQIGRGEFKTHNEVMKEIDND